MKNWMVYILVVLSLVCSWALWRCTQERDACRGELFIAHQRPSVWLRAEDFEMHGFTPSPTPADKRTPKQQLMAERYEREVKEAKVRK